MQAKDLGLGLVESEGSAGNPGRDLEGVEGRARPEVGPGFIHSVLTAGSLYIPK